MSFLTHIDRELSAFHRGITEPLPSNLILKATVRIFRFVGEPHANGVFYNTVR